jgi:hypothetical protein
MEKIEFVRMKNGKLYWEPSRKLRALNFKPKNWINDAAGRENARKETARAKRAIETRKALPGYLEGSLGHFWHHYRTRLYDRVDHGEIAHRTAEEYDTAWLHIKPVFGDTTITDITPDDIIEFDRELGRSKTLRTRKRAMSKLRAILEDAVLRQVIPVNPTKGVRIKGTKARQSYFAFEEIQTLADTATALKMDAMSLCIRLMYETARAPVDARSLNLGALRADQDGPYIDRAREKTGVGGFQSISQQLYDDIMAYVGGLGVSLMPDAPIFRRHAPTIRKRRKVAPWKGSDEFARDFKNVREAALGKDETRMAMDIRRTANLEAALGDATPSDRAALLANSLDKDAGLDAVHASDPYRRQTCERKARQRPGNDPV